MSTRKILNNKKIDIILNRLVCQLIEKHLDFKNTILIGLQPRGVFLLDRLILILEKKYKILNLNYGKLDTTFFRDDFRRSNKPLKANSSIINVSIEGKSIVFIDDVLYTGRSIRAALTAIETYGRPVNIELLVLIDRRFSRHLPIQPDYVGMKVDALQNDIVKVNWKQNDNEDSIYLLKKINE